MTPSGEPLKLLAERVLDVFAAMGKETLDLHVLFEAGGNDPAQRHRVLDALEALEARGLVEARGNDFYALTARGKQALEGR